MCVTQKYTTEESADAWLDGTHEHQIGLSYDSDYTSGNIAGVLQYAFQAWPIQEVESAQRDFQIQ